MTQPSQSMCESLSRRLSLAFLAGALVLAGCGGKPLSSLSVVGPGTAPTDDGHIVPWSGANGVTSAGGARLAINDYRVQTTPCICCLGLPALAFNTPLMTAAQRHADYQGVQGGAPTHNEINTSNPNYVALYYPDRIRAANTPPGTDLYAGTTFVYYENVADAW